MAESQYSALQLELNNLFPGFSVLGLNQYCLVGACSASPYKRSGIHEGNCDTPTCLNIVSFNNNGTLTNSSIEIIQSSSDCVEYTGGITPIPPEPTPTPPGTTPVIPLEPPVEQPNPVIQGYTFWQRYGTWIIVGVIVFVLIIVILIIL
jgi:hypothetical protein